VSEFLEGIIFGIFFWIVGVNLLRYWILSKIENDPEIQKMVNQKIKELELVELVVEKHQDTLYCYKKENDEFVAQGKTLEDILEICRKKFPKDSFRIIKEEKIET
jgi:hypothetical protein